MTLVFGNAMFKGIMSWVHQLGLNSYSWPFRAIELQQVFR